MMKRIRVALIASTILVTGLAGRAVAQINGSQAVDYEAFKRAILAARYAHDPRLIPPLQGKPASVANLGLQSYGPQADSAGNAARAGDFVPFDAPGAGTGVNEGTYAFAINPMGAIAGYYIDATGAYHGFLRARDGTVSTVDPENSVFTQIWSINPAGTVTGDYCDTIACHGFLRTADGAITTFDIADAVLGLYPFSINPEGDVTGEYFDANFVSHGFVRASDGSISTFDASEAGTGAFLGTFAYGINPRGTVAGCYLDANRVGHGLVRASDGALTTFDVPNSTNLECFADDGFFFLPYPIMGINPAGAITGSYFEPISGNPFGGNNRGFVRAPDGTFTTFDAVSSPSSPCCTWTFGIAINPAGEVAGWDNDYLSVNHGFVRAKHGTVTILDAPGAGTGLNEGTLAWSINPAGEVAGFYSDANNVYHGFLWSKHCHGEGHENSASGDPDGDGCESR